MMVDLLMALGGELAIGLSPVAPAAPTAVPAVTTVATITNVPVKSAAAAPAPWDD
jgi:hypothetical protein